MLHAGYINNGTGFRHGKAVWKILIFGCWLFMSTVIFSQVNKLPTFKKQLFTTANGLCNNNIRVITKDNAGYLWMGTANGLSRFDGHYFTNFFHTPGDTNTLGHNFIHGIINCKDGNIWILHVMGLSLFNSRTQTFSNFPIQMDYPHFSGTYFDFEEDINGNIWIGNQNGLAIFNTNKKQYLSAEKLDQYLFIKNNGFAGTGINGLAKGEKGKIWFNNFQTLFCWNPVDRKMLEINKNAFNGLSGISVNYADTTSGTLFIGTFNKGLMLFNYQTATSSLLHSSPEALSTQTYDPVRNVQPYAPGLDVYISELGIGFFDKVGDKLLSLKPVPLRNDAGLLSMLADSSHIWVGTENGLLLLTNEKIKTENITPPNRNKGAFNTVQVHSQQPNIFTGNYNIPVIYQLPAAGGLKTDLKGVVGFLRYYFTDSKGNDWLSTEDAIYKKKRGVENWVKIVMHPSGLNSQTVLPRNFIEDSDGNIWVRIRNEGLCIFDSIKNIFIHYKNPELPENSIFSGLVYIHATHTLWLSEENSGLHALDLASKKWTQHPLQLGNTRFTPDRIVAGKDGSIAFPDPFNGIGIYYPVTKKIKLISQKEGLLSNNISSLEADAEGNFWTHSTEGISKIMAKDFSVINYQDPALVKIQEIACGNDGMVYVAAAEGLYRFNGNLLVPHNASGKLLINTITIMGKSYPFSESFMLPPGMNDIQINFSLIDLYSGKQPQFEYRFEKDKEWKNLGTTNTISLSRLSPGDYQLSIREKDNKIPEQWQCLSWTIEKPYWQRTWFLASILIIMGGTLYYYTQKRIRSIREKALLKQKISDTEMAALRAQMNPHFIFNSINCIDAMVQDGDKYNATTYLNKFAKLIRNVLDGSRTNTVSLQTDMKTLELYIELEHMRMDGKFDWKINLDEAILMKDIKVPSLIIQPYVENAILHGIRHLIHKKGLLEITVDYKDGNLFYTIKDNGVGRDFSQTVQKTQYSSYGMEITENRIMLATKGKNNLVTILDLKNDDGTAAGTEVNITLHLS